MSLPPALAERLSQRGLYVATPPKATEQERKRDLRGVIGCPNKSNIHHDCTHWCEVHWKPANTPEPKYVQNISKLIQKYPLPHSWTEIYDPGMKSYYFWDMETDRVSWLPPLHPKAKPSKSAAKKREKRLRQLREEKILHKQDEIRGKRRSKASRKSHSRRLSPEKRIKHDDKKGARKLKRPIIDPMDPAAYSNIPVGTWSDGLEFKKPDNVDLPSNKPKKGISFGIAHP